MDRTRFSLVYIALIVYVGINENLFFAEMWRKANPFELEFATETCSLCLREGFFEQTCGYLLKKLDRKAF